MSLPPPHRAFKDFRTGVRTNVEPGSERIVGNPSTTSFEKSRLCAKRLI